LYYATLTTEIKKGVVKMINVNTTATTTGITLTLYLHHSRPNGF